MPIKKSQTKSEFQKNYTRINDIISKSLGDKEKEIILATTQAKLITDEAKCVNRAKVARELGYEHLFEVFFRRAYQLGAVKKSDYRDYVLSKILQ